MMFVCFFYIFWELPTSTLHGLFVLYINNNPSLPQYNGYGDGNVADITKFGDDFIAWAEKKLDADDPMVQKLEEWYKSQAKYDGIVHLVMEKIRMKKEHLGEGIIMRHHAKAFCTALIY